MRHKEFLKYSFKISFSPMLLFEFYFKIIFKVQYVYDIFQICELYSTLAWGSSLNKRRNQTKY